MKNGRLKIVLYSLVLIALLILFFKKDKLTCFVTNYMLRHNSAVVVPNDSIKFFSQFDYANRQTNYKLTVVELSGNGCKPCLRMDTVLSKIAKVYAGKVKIITYKLVNDSTMVIAKYFGVNMIPTQIVLNKNGLEVFRHTGFFSEKEFIIILNEYLKND